MEMYLFVHLEQLLLIHQSLEMFLFVHQKLKLQNMLKSIVLYLLFQKAQQFLAQFMEMSTLFQKTLI